jgi:hypothetical protein
MAQLRLTCPRYGALVADIVTAHHFLPSTEAAPAAQELVQLLGGAAISYLDAKWHRMEPPVPGPSMFKFASRASQ